MNWPLLRTCLFIAVVTNTFSLGRLSVEFSGAGSDWAVLNFWHYSAGWMPHWARCWGTCARQAEGKLGRLASFNVRRAPVRANLITEIR
jgi:hypothetical protein